MKKRIAGWKDLAVMRTCVAIILCATVATVVYAAAAREIETSVDVCLERFHKEVKGAGEYTKIAKGMLVLPNVYKGGSSSAPNMVKGAPCGCKTVDYYSIAPAPSDFRSV